LSEQTNTTKFAFMPKIICQVLSTWILNKMLNFSTEKKKKKLVSATKDNRKLANCAQYWLQLDLKWKHEHKAMLDKKKRKRNSKMEFLTKFCSAKKELPRNRKLRPVAM